MTLSRPAGRRPQAPGAGADASSGRAAGGNLGEALAGLFGGLGVEASSTRDAVTDAVAGALAERGHRAEVIELRYGTLTLRADPVAAKLLGYDRDQLLAVLERAQPGVVERIRIRTR